MGQNELIMALEEEGRSEVRRILEEANQQAGALIGKAEEEAAFIQDARMKTAATEFEKVRTARINSAGLKARGLVLQVKYELMDALFKEALEEIQGSKDYPRILGRFYNELKESWSYGGPVIHVNPSDVEHLRAKDVEITPDEGVSGGVEFRSKDKRLRFSNTLATRLERVRGMLAGELDRLLFS